MRRNGASRVRCGASGTAPRVAAGLRPQEEGLQMVWPRPDQWHRPKPGTDEEREGLGESRREEQPDLSVCRW